MSDVIELDLDCQTPTDDDNITDWCLEQFHARYGEHITKDDIWEYLYGVMHAPDWRERYKHDLQRNLPRVPLADDFEAFRTAGRALMDLHINYETVNEYPLVCLVDNEVDAGEADPEAYGLTRECVGPRTAKKPTGQCSKSTTAANSSTSRTKPTSTPSRAARRSTGPSTASDSNTTSPPVSPTTPTVGTTGPTNPSTSSVTCVGSPISRSKPAESSTTSLHH